MCSLKLIANLPIMELRERLRLEDIVAMLQWYGTGSGIKWLKKCMDYEVQGAKPGRMPKWPWKEAVEADVRDFKRKRKSVHSK